VYCVCLRTERRTDDNNDLRSQSQMSGGGRSKQIRKHQEEQKVQMEQQKQKMEKQTQRTELQSQKTEQQSNARKTEQKAEQQEIQQQKQSQKVEQHRQTRKMEQFQEKRQQHHETTATKQWPEPPPPPPQRDNQQQLEKTPPLPPPPEEDRLDSRVEEWVRQMSTEATVDNKELEKMALDIAETVVENMEKDKKMMKKEEVERGNTCFCPALTNPELRLLALHNIRVFLRDFFVPHLQS
jgi:hypothetical protein